MAREGSPRVNYRQTGGYPAAGGRDMAETLADCKRADRDSGRPPTPAARPLARDGLIRICLGWAGPYVFALGCLHVSGEVRRQHQTLRNMFDR